MRTIKDILEDWERIIRMVKFAEWVVATLTNVRRAHETDRETLTRIVKNQIGRDKEKRDGA